MCENYAKTLVTVIMKHPVHDDKITDSDFEDYFGSEKTCAS